MKRDWDLIREILSRLENLKDTDAFLTLADFSREQSFEVSYNVDLLLDARLVEGKMLRTLDGGPVNFHLRHLSWAGHEFLDAIRSETVWANTKRTIAAKGLDLTFELVKSVAAGITESIMRGP